MSSLKSRSPKGSWVLVTGATGHIAVHTTRQLPEHGFRVRGTVRDLNRATWLTQHVFSPFADRGDLELVQVPDLGAQHAFDEAIKGVSAVAHIASILSFSDSPQDVIPPAVDSMVSILEAAAREPSAKSIVYTSSIAATVDLSPEVTAHAGPDAWNDHAVEAEKTLWAFVKKNKPHYTVNVVSPATVLGEALGQRHLVSPYPLVKNLYDGNEEIGALLQAIIHVDVKDVALLHVAVVLDPDCNGARLQAQGEYCNMNDILAILRRLHPEKKSMNDFPNQTELRITAEYDQLVELLRKRGGQDGWTPLKNSVIEEIEGALKWFP
ncbi:hypothetical protein CPAR01_11204 [Colletotrichum paranaense]|uniref:NAD-dependent epimerase/dehydratase domain-containing protein n=1 Tax=Colletotrichum paranaense TaxID=1914294 RepID=A0ABQ9SAZ2_9PEZI|nr:uncharacterized protein CPAR01_11204 [Colletotrichum paranaense]KAK1531555.1 hypothetical protein CPAR01_11204 [Colletotrichum paranaense]